MIPFKALRNKNGVVSLPCEYDYLHNLSAAEIEQAEQEADKIEWPDIVTLYDEEELDFTDFHNEPGEGLHPDEVLDTHDNQYANHSDEEEIAQLQEGLSAGQRAKRRLIFSRSKARRRMAMKIALHRQSNPQRLQKRSKAMAKRILTKKILRGRKRSQLSPQEKDRLEKMLRTSSPIIARIAQRVMPRIKAIEQTRLKHTKKKKVYEMRLPPEAYNNVEGPVTIPTPAEIAIMNSEPSLLKKVRKLRADNS